MEYLLFLEYLYCNNSVEFLHKSIYIVMLLWSTYCFWSTYIVEVLFLYANPALAASHSILSWHTLTDLTVRRLSNVGNHSHHGLYKPLLEGSATVKQVPDIEGGAALFKGNFNTDVFG